MKTPHVVADVDTGIDDALALIYLAHLHRQGEIELTVTTSAGNCTAQDAAANSAEVLRCCGVSLSTPIVPGAASPRELELTTTPETHGPNGLGYWEAHRSARVEALNGPRTQDPRWPGWDGTARLAVEQWKQAEPDYLLVAGPATNIAYAVEHAPEVLSGCTVVFMAGAFDYPGNTTETAEWNVWVDPHALRYALENWPRDAKAPLMCSLNETEKVLLYPERLVQWQNMLEQRTQKQVSPQLNRELARMMGDALRFYFEFHESVGVGYCAQIHDLAAAQVMLGNVGFNSREASIAVDVAGQRRGTTYVTGDGSAVRIVDELNSAEVFEEFERAVLESTKS
ncbi:inosine-uridine preferring nucleoside hydrolase [Corynebacterium resistens DSM 45100]|uniref:Inosine-uridine preferring nucleoside hydrolase n=1 Tax=Corynebacterium resistens (strain DSM 45100 / JCM 12819 / GTC 2026 / SICGH 158) TaxID=662755 RepID=F8E2U4_CORRG|nr:nucleoside hydrolase [Corynebacterium resistens]AEI08642.1 inosine-uridine preferring nucleoside hydrolase [Corynebacterium resistens DSM 45100]